MMGSTLNLRPKHIQVLHKQVLNNNKNNNLIIYFCLVNLLLNKRLSFLFTFERFIVRSFVFVLLYFTLLNLNIIISHFVFRMLQPIF